VKSAVYFTLLNVTKSQSHQSFAAAWRLPLFGDGNTSYISSGL